VCVALETALCASYPEACACQPKSQMDRCTVGSYRLLVVFATGRPVFAVLATKQAVVCLLCLLCRRVLVFAILAPKQQSMCRLSDSNQPEIEGRFMCVEVHKCRTWPMPIGGDPLRCDTRREVLIDIDPFQEDQGARLLI